MGRRGVLDLLYQVQVRDREGRLIRSTGLRRSRSLVKNFLVFVGCWLRDADMAGAKDTGGTARTADISYVAAFRVMNTSYDPGAGSRHQNGVVVGSGTTTPANTDYALATLILDGSTSGKLDHGTMSYVNTAEEGGYVVFKMSRTFTNNSGAAIVIREIGLIGVSPYDPTTSGFFLYVRDVLSEAYSVAALGTVTVQYVIRTAA